MTPSPISDVVVADTNVYLTAANDDAFRSRFEAFVAEHGPLLVSAIVVAEILIGIPDPSKYPEAVRAMSAGTRILSPTAEDWIGAAAAVARLGGDSVTKSRSFWNDALLAAQCARIGAGLLTHNSVDFRRLGRHMGVRTVLPFP